MYCRKASNCLSFLLDFNVSSDEKEETLSLFLFDVVFAFFGDLSSSPNIDRRGQVTAFQVFNSDRCWLAASSKESIYVRKTD